MTDANIPLLDDLTQRVKAFAFEAHSILGRHETSPSRIVLLEESYAKLASFTLKQDELLRQSLRCVEHELYRAAHVMAWAAFMDFFEEKLMSDGLKRLRVERPKWPHSAVEDLRESVNEYQLIDAARDVGLCSKNQAKALHGLLNKRNECAHPSDYFPDLNDTLGFITESFFELRHSA